MAGTSLAFEDAAEILGHLNFDWVGIEILGPTFGELVMWGGGSVQHIEWASAEKEELLLHGDAWHVVVRNTDEFEIQDGGVIQIKRVDRVRIQIINRKEIPVAPVEEVGVDG